jgi:hypothetical protein
MLDVFADTPTGNQFGPPSTSFSRAGALAPRWGSAALGSLRSPSLRLAPTGGKGGGRQSNLQKQIYTNGQLGVEWVNFEVFLGSAAN